MRADAEGHQCQTPSKRRTDGRTNTHGNNVHRDRRRQEWPPSRRVDVAATRDKRTDGQTPRI